MAEALLHVPRARAVRKTGISVPDDQGTKVTESITINRSPQELYDFWRKLENLPRFMKHLVSVTQTSETDSHWIGQSPSGRKMEWDATIINEHPGELIAWRTLEGSDVAHAGSVRFKAAPANRGTELTVSFEYTTATGKLGAKLAKLIGKEPGQQVEKDLIRLKALLETGEVPTTVGQPGSEGQTQEEA